MRILSRNLKFSKWTGKFRSKVWCFWNWLERHAGVHCYILAMILALFSRFFPYNFLEANFIPKSVVLQIAHGYIFICWFSFWYLFFHYVLFHYRRLIIINMLSNCLDESIFIEITHIMSVPLKLCLEKCPVNVFNSDIVVLISPKMSFNRSPYKVKSHTTKIISNYDIWPLFCCWSVSCMW